MLSFQSLKFKISLSSKLYRLKYHMIIVTFHLSLFLFILILSNLFFQNDLQNTLWSTYANDTWKFIRNTLEITSPLYPYHLLGTSLHFVVPYYLFSIFLSPPTAMFITIVSVQFLASLLALLLLSTIFQEIFNLDKFTTINLILFFDFIIFGPYLILGTSEILFLLYQLLAWFFYTRNRYIISALFTAMTFALRFNGAFFVLGMASLFFYKWYKKKNYSLKLFFKTILTLIAMFFIGFLTFILCFIRYNDFFMPLTSETLFYQQYEGYASVRIFTIPFVWLSDYVNWVFLQHSPVEFLLLILTLFFIILELFSLYCLIQNQSSSINLDWNKQFLIIFLFSFLGLSVINSGRNFTRFCLFLFPILPCVAIWCKRTKFSTRTTIIFQVFGFLVCLIVNLIWWSAVIPGIIF